MAGSSVIEKGHSRPIRVRAARCDQVPDLGDIEQPVSLRSVICTTEITVTLTLENYFTNQVLNALENHKRDTYREQNLEQVDSHGAELGRYVRTIRVTEKASSERPARSRPGAREGSSCCYDGGILP